ncbi:histidine kinase [Paucilactobacillus hokkaidonensis]|nr:histidine kinase [Paucilactobacillus hokkaidonensis]
MIINDPTNQKLKLHSRNVLIEQLARKINILLDKHSKNEQQLFKLKNEQDVAIHNIAHDLRTPLTVASGYTQVLLENSNLQSDDQQSLERIEQNLSNVSEHLDLLLMYNRLSENEVSLNWQKINVTNMLQETILGMYDLFTNKTIELKLNIQSNCWWVADHEALLRIFQNILGNILQHGIISASVSLTCDDENLWIKFENKISQPINSPDKLTNRFYTEDLARQSENAGLGLYITEKLTNIMHGQVLIQTENNNFKVELQFTKRAYN